MGGGNDRDDMGKWMDGVGSIFTEEDSDEPAQQDTTTSDEKPGCFGRLFSCCGKDSAEKDSKKFKCDHPDCKKTFKTSTELATHKKTHKANNTNNNNQNQDQNNQDQDNQNQDQDNQNQDQDQDQTQQKPETDPKSK